MKGKIRSEQDRQGLIEVIQKLDLSKVFFWEVKKHIRRRSISQNSLYWLWLTCIQDETGNNRADLHELYFKPRYIIPKIVIIFDKSEERRSTKDLSTEQFKEYLDKIQAEMSSEGIVLPDPDDLQWDSFYEYYKNKL